MSGRERRLRPDMPQHSLINMIITITSVVVVVVLTAHIVTSDILKTIFAYIIVLSTSCNVR